ncbi:MAG: NAD-dependent deacylase [Deltaproteobacteria bacterium]|nr:NAD-dependent deacylase [Deltaproteobacteria bacterium]
MKAIDQAAQIIRDARRIVAFTGAGISVESGIPPFRGPDGLWATLDPTFLELGYFLAHPKDSWRQIREIFYEFFGAAKPNAAHEALAKLEVAGKLDAIITQNIDNLHQEAGNRVVHEYHGTAQRMVCLTCGHVLSSTEVSLKELPPRCSRDSCGGLLKPDFIFFGEGIPPSAAHASMDASANCDVMLVIGTTGEIMPASALPHVAKEAGATIIEVNPGSSTYTPKITDVHLQGKATTMMTALIDALGIGISDPPRDRTS